MIDNPKLGNQGPQTRLDQEGNYPKVIRTQEAATKMTGGGNSVPMGQSLTLESHEYTENTSGIVGRLPEGSKRLLGISG